MLPYPSRGMQCRQMQHAGRVVAGSPIAPMCPRLSCAGSTATEVPMRQLLQHCRTQRNLIAAASAVAVPSVPSVLSPAAAYENVANVGAASAARPSWKILVMGILGAMYIGFGAILSICIGGNIPGIAAANPGLQRLITALVFPLGQLIVTLVGAELFTGNTAVITAAVLEGKANMRMLAKSWFWSYLGNWIGAYLMAAAVTVTGVLTSNTATTAVNIALGKTSLPLDSVFMRSVLCNWLVCIGLWMAGAAQSLPGKAIGGWVPTTAFVAIGLENAVANMFFITLGIMAGAQISYGELWLKNVIPATLGNACAGIIMAVSYSMLFGTLDRRLQLRA